MQQKKSEKILVLALVVVAMIIFSFVDLSLSMAVYNPQSIFGIIFEAFGEWPAFLAGIFGGAMLLLFPVGKKTVSQVFSRIGGVLLLLMASTTASMFALKAFNVLKTPLFIILSILLIVLGILVAKMIPEKLRHNARQVAMMGAVLFLTTMIVFNTVKFSWGRMRFRDMTDPLMQFTPWYIPQGATTSNTYMSFPSGHAAWSSVILILTVLPGIFPNLKDKSKLFNVISYGFIILVAFSRIVMGAHFGSDVTIGFFITWVLFQLWQKVFLSPKRLQPIE